MMVADFRKTRERYRKRWEKYGYDPRTLGWNKGRQGVRFTAAIENLRYQEFASVLDVGCGFGDFFGHLRGKGWDGQYTGVDIVPELIREARRRHLGEKVIFHCRDMERRPLEVTAAMGVVLGVFNHRLIRDNMEFISSMLEIVWKSTTAVVVLDFLSARADIQRDDLFYADPEAIYRLATRFSRRVMIHHAYAPFEFQVKIWHDDAFSISAPVFSPYVSLVDKNKGGDSESQPDSPIGTPQFSV